MTKLPALITTKWLDDNNACQEHQEVQKMTDRQETLLKAMGQLAEITAQCQKTAEHLHKFQLIAFETERNLQVITDTVLFENFDNPKALGSNEETRKACLRVRCTDEQSKADNAQRSLLVARQAFDLAKMEMDAFKLRVRLLELGLETNDDN